MGLKTAQLFCVYRHISPSGKVYVGITSKKPEHRWNNGKAYKQNRYFTNAINRYGWESFEHDVLFDGLQKDEACALEMELIKKYKSNDPSHGYNLSVGGESPAFGARWSKEQREKASKARRGKKASKETCKAISEAKKGRTNGLKGRKGRQSQRAGIVVQIDEATGEEVAEFFGYYEMNRKTGYAQTPVKEAANGKRKRAYGYKWKYIKRGNQHVVI